jgi:hypothetical protein
MKVPAAQIIGLATSSTDICLECVRWRSEICSFKQRLFEDQRCLGGGMARFTLEVTVG